jgi:transcriptional regulator with XRE-family HTH domain
MRTTSPRLEVAANMRAELARRGLVQRHLAAFMGWTRSSTSRRLDGTTPIDIDEVYQVAEFFGMPPLALFPDVPATSAKAS